MIRRMADLHDAAYREAMKARLRAVTAESPRKWGTMTADQMLWHLAEGLRSYVAGEVDVTGMKAPPLPKGVVRFLVLNLPWPKGAPTMNVMKAVAHHDLEAERTRCLQLMDELAEFPPNEVRLQHPFFGRMTGRDCSRLQAKHVEHHLRQFGV
jgi:hypothetical protein